jgi:membrane dipeptidase
MIRRIAESGGVVHINYYSGFLSDEYRSKKDQEKHFDEALADARRRLAGDFRELAAAEWRINMRKIEAVGRVPFQRLLDHFEHAVKVGGVEHVGLGSDFDGVDEELPEGVEDVSKLPHLAEGLRSRGLSSEDVEKILGANSVRVMRDVEAAAG